MKENQLAVRWTLSLIYQADSVPDLEGVYIVAVDKNIKRAYIANGSQAMKGA